MSAPPGVFVKDNCCTCSLLPGIYIYWVQVIAEPYATYANCRIANGNTNPGGICGADCPVSTLGQMGDARDTAWAAVNAFDFFNPSGPDPWSHYGSMDFRGTQYYGIGAFNYNITGGPAYAAVQNTFYRNAGVPGNPSTRKFPGPYSGLESYMSSDPSIPCFNIPIVNAIRVLVIGSGLTTVCRSIAKGSNAAGPVAAMETSPTILSCGSLALTNQQIPLPSGAFSPSCIDLNTTGVYTFCAEGPWMFDLPCLDCACP